MPGCSKCGGKRASGQVTTSTIQSTKFVKDDNGLLPLANYPDCTERYHGQFTGAQLFVVGRGKPSERLYLKSRFREAATYMREKGTTIDRVRAVDLCHDAVVQLLGG